MRSRLGGVVAIGAVLVLAVTAAAFWLRVAPPARPVAIVGDSITAWGAGSLEDRLSSRWELRIEAVPGNTVADQLPAAEALALRQPAAVQLVVNLGTNDAAQMVPIDASMASLRQMLAAYPDVPCIHLVTVTDRLLDEDGTRGDPWPAARAVNDGLRTFTTDPRVRIVDWAALLDRADAEGRVLLIDAVHPNDAGNEVLADAIGASLGACPLPRPGT